MTPDIEQIKARTEAATPAAHNTQTDLEHLITQAAALEGASE